MKSRRIRFRRARMKIRMVLFVDYLNIEAICDSALSSQAKAVKAINRIIDVERILTDLGTIEAKFAFVPDHRMKAAMELSSKFRYLLFVCPPSFSKNTIMADERRYKDKDLVDVRMSNLSNAISIWGQDITHIAFVTGDGDFVDAVDVAHTHQKKVIVAADERHLSSALANVADKVIFM